MDFLKNINWKPVNVLKAVLFVVGGLLVLAIILSLVKVSFSKLSKNTVFSVAPSSGGVSYGVDTGYAYNESVKMYGANSGMPTPSLSVRNIGPIMPPMGGVIGDQAEAFEVTDYSATIEASNLEETCGAVADLKVYTYVIFENESEYDKGCNFVFKVEHKKVSEIVAVIKELDPKDFSENTYTIKRLVDDFTSEAEILQKKKSSLEETLRTALRAYDEIAALATRTQNVESLAKIIDSRIQIIERLTLESININEQLERLTRAKVEQLDRLEYAYFRVNVYENTYFDGESLKDSWQAAIKDFVRTINRIFQDITINLIVLIFFLAQLAIYAFIILVVVKYGWRITKKIWYR